MPILDRSWVWRVSAVGWWIWRSNCRVFRSHQTWWPFYKASFWSWWLGKRGKDATSNTGKLKCIVFFCLWHEVVISVEGAIWFIQDDSITNVFQKCFGKATQFCSEFTFIWIHPLPSKFWFQPLSQKNMEKDHRQSSTPLFFAIKTSELVGLKEWKPSSFNENLHLKFVRIGQHWFYGQMFADTWCVTNQWMKADEARLL